MAYVKDVLVRARALVAQGWTQEYWAKRSDGVYVSALSLEAASWCVLGACKRAMYEVSGGKVTVAPVAVSDALQKWLPSYVGVTEGLAGFNDAPGRTKAEVLALFDKAIAAQGEVSP